MRLALLASVLLAIHSGCAPSAAPTRHDYRSSVPVGRHDPPPRPAVACAQLPRTVGGFRFGPESSFGHVGTQCIDAGFQWTTSRDGGMCSGTPASVGPASWARFRRCGLRVCSTTIGFVVGGQTALQRAAADRLAQLTELYGEGVWQLDAGRPCPRVEGDDFGCVLDGVGVVVIRWHVEDPGDDDDSCEATSGLVELRVEGDRGTHDATVTTTYAQRDAIDAASTVDL